MVSLPIVVLIFLSSNPSKENWDDAIAKLPILQPEKGVADDRKNPRGFPEPVNDLSVSGVKFPDDSSKMKVLGDKKIREKIMPDEKSTTKKTPVPLYSLVKNECGEGYSLDQNGVCQKSISVRSGKTFDSERRKRNAPFSELVNEEEEKIFFTKLITTPSPHHKKKSKHLAGDGFGKASLRCSQLYPGFVPDGAGGCTKPVRKPDGVSGKREHQEILSIANIKKN